MFVHLANMSWWALIYLGSYAVAATLAGGADLLRNAGTAGLATGIDSVLQLFAGWLKWAPAALGAYALLGWLPSRRAILSGAGLRAYPCFLALALLFRRSSFRRLRPARGLYWRHARIRDRWLLLLIKIHFLPIAVGSLVNTAVNMTRVIQRITAEPSMLLVLGFIIVAVRVSVDLVDAVVSSIAYSVESRRSGGAVRAVDNNWLGWVSCLVCYPPGWLLTSSLLAKRIEEEAQIFPMESTLAWVCAVLGVSCYAVYGFSAVNLGLRYSNLSYRGTTTWGLYRWVRHPQYASKIGGWFFEWLPFFAVFSNLLSFLALAGIYLVRIATEERFLGRFSEYRDYCRQVKWRCIPGIW